MSEHHSLCEAGEARDHIKWMALKQSGHQFSGEEYINVTEFLREFVSEVSFQNMSESQVLVASHSFLVEFAKSHYEAGMKMGLSNERGVSS